MLTFVVYCFAKLQAGSSSSQTVDGIRLSAACRVAGYQRKALFWTLNWLPSLFPVVTNAVKATENTWKKPFSNITLPYEQEVQLSLGRQVSTDRKAGGLQDSKRELFRGTRH